MHLKCGVRRFKWERQRDIFRENGNIIGPCVKWSPSFVCANAMQHNTTQPRIQFDTKRVILVLVFVVCIHIELSNSINFLFIFSCFNTYFRHASLFHSHISRINWLGKRKWDSVCSVIECGGLSWYKLNYCHFTWKVPLIYESNIA